MCVFTQGHPVGAAVPERYSRLRVTWKNKEVRGGDVSQFLTIAVSICLRLAVHFYNTVVIIVIIYHYSGRERKIVSTDDMGAVCRACCNSW